MPRLLKMLSNVPSQCQFCGHSAPVNSSGPSNQIDQACQSMQQVCLSTSKEAFTARSRSHQGP